jgi:hypothetical protein
VAKTVAGTYVSKRYCNKGGSKGPPSILSDLLVGHRDQSPFGPVTEMMRPNTGFHANQTGRHVGKPTSTWPRDQFWRSTMAPRLSRPTAWNEFFLTDIDANHGNCTPGFWDMARTLSLVPLPSF